MLIPTTPDTNSGFLVLLGKTTNISHVVSIPFHDSGPIILCSLILNDSLLTLHRHNGHFLVS